LCEIRREKFKRHSCNKTLMNLPLILSQVRFQDKILPNLKEDCFYISILDPDDLGYRYMKMVQNCAQLSVYINKKGENYEIR